MSWHWYGTCSDLVIYSGTHLRHIVLQLFWFKTVAILVEARRTARPGKFAMGFLGGCASAALWALSCDCVAMRLRDTCSVVSARRMRDVVLGASGCQSIVVTARLVGMAHTLTSSVGLRHQLLAAPPNCLLRVDVSTGRRRQLPRRASPGDAGYSNLVPSRAGHG